MEGGSWKHQKGDFSWAGRGSQPNPCHPCKCHLEMPGKRVEAPVFWVGWCCIREGALWWMFSDFSLGFTEDGARQRGLNCSWRIWIRHWENLSLHPWWWCEGRLRCRSSLVLSPTSSPFSPLQLHWSSFCFLDMPQGLCTHSLSSVPCLLFPLMLNPSYSDLSSHGTPSRRPPLTTSSKVAGPHQLLPNHCLVVFLYWIYHYLYYCISLFPLSVHFSSELTRL